MKQSTENIAVVGTGVIGTGWILRFLFNKKKVFVFDPQLKQKKFLVNEIKRVKPILNKLLPSLNKTLEEPNENKYSDALN